MICISTRAFPAAIAVLALTSVQLNADPLTYYEAAGCVYYGNWPAVGTKAVCTTDYNVCTYVSTETGVSKSCVP